MNRNSHHYENSFISLSIIKSTSQNYTQQYNLIRHSNMKLIRYYTHLIICLPYQN